MYGYVLPDKDKLSDNDYLMFQSLYCGLCIELKGEYGQLSRFTTNYDIVVFGLIIIEITKCEIEFEAKRCIANFKKKGVVKSNEFLKRLCAINILLTYYKATDDEMDSGGKKKLARYILKKPYKKAKEMLPTADKIIADGYNRLRELERQNCGSIDMVCDCFASLLADLIKDFSLGLIDELPDNYNDTYYKMCYNLGKFVYLADGLDDIGEDAKKKNYNPFLAKYGKVEGDVRKEIFQQHGDEIKFNFTSTINRAIECCNYLTFTHINDLIRNIIYYGLRKKAEELFTAEKQLERPKF